MIGFFPHVAIRLPYNRSVSIPLRPGPDGRVDLEVRLPDGTTHRETLELSALRSSGALRAATITFPETAGWLRIELSQLPRRPDGYGPLAALALTSGDLAALDPEQTRALGHYLEACGTLLLDKVSKTVLGRIRAASGCGGRQIHPATDGLEPAQKLVEGASGPDQERDEPPTDSFVRASHPGSHSPVHRALRLFLPYGLLLAALPLLRRPGIWVLAVPLVGALLVWHSLPRAVPRAQAWVHGTMVSGDPSVRINAVLELSGDGHGPRPVRLGPELGLPTPLDGQSRQIRLTESGTSIPGPEALFESNRYLVHGVVQSPIRLAFSVDSRGIRVRNDTSDPVSGAWLASDRGLEALPTLGPGENRWSPGQAPPDPNDGGAALPATPDGLPEVRGPALILPWPERADPLYATPGLGPTWLVVYPMGAAS